MTTLEDAASEYRRASALVAAAKLRTAKARAGWEQAKQDVEEADIAEANAWYQLQGIALEEPVA